MVARSHENQEIHGSSPDPGKKNIKSRIYLGILFNNNFTIIAIIKKHKRNDK